MNSATENTDPIALFSTWLNDATLAKQIEPTAMTLATVDEQGRPHARTLLLKGVDSDGFHFFTNYTSDKGKQLEHNPHASLVFYWNQIDRQVRVCGSVTRLTKAQSDAYFATRPRLSQIGAWASYQSKVMDSRATLEQRIEERKERFAGVDVPRPSFWGGYRLKPVTIEFWMSVTGRLHQRWRYRRNQHSWDKDYLFP